MYMWGLYLNNKLASRESNCLFGKVLELGQLRVTDLLLACVEMAGYWLAW
jgi:hypothetical protein